MADHSTTLPQRFPVLSTGISALTLSRAVQIILGWAGRDEKHYVSVCTSDLVLRCHDDAGLAKLINGAGIVTPDGMPLVWCGRLKGHDVERVYGPDLMLAVCREGRPQKLRHFFWGSTPDVLHDLSVRLTEAFPDLIIAGTHSPPFRDPTPEDDDDAVRIINDAAPDVVWVGLGTPKQDYWVHRLRSRLNAPVLIPVGAAFGFHSGHLRQAPRWIMATGLEWLFRLAVEPRRLWRRYIIGNPRFIYHVLRQGIRARSSAGTAGRDTKEASPAPAESDIPRVNVLGVGVHAVNMETAVARIVDAALQRERGYVCVTSVHGVIEARSDDDLRRIHNRSLLTVPDGMPTVWTGRQHGFRKMARVYGPDLMLEVCKASVPPSTPRPLRHFLYGATPDTLARLTGRLERMIPGIEIAGAFAPPFRPLTDAEERDLHQQVCDSSADLFWVGLSTPKQERFMAGHTDGFPACIMLGVGAAFDLHAGLKSDAPDWVKRTGLQWFHRLCQEPRRLWRRYLYIVPAFITLSVLAALGLKSTKLQTDETDQPPR